MGKNCLLCGVGGQGVVLASKLIAYAAIEKGLNVRTSETIGMSQRGGSVVTHVRMGETVHSPMIPKGTADVIMAFEPAEAVRNLSYLKEDGVMVVDKKAVKPVTATLSQNKYDGQKELLYLQENVKNLYIVDGDAICEEAGSSKVLNVVLLGVALGSGVLDIQLEEMKEEIKKHVKPQFVEMNIKALELGAKVTI
jgi:indolepyruvate ferredoxin oxidoreductase beta subunit